MRIVVSLSKKVGCSPAPVVDKWWSPKLETVKFDKKASGGRERPYRLINVIWKVGSCGQSEKVAVAVRSSVCRPDAGLTQSESG